MKLLYYPGFDVTDELWLKFALLYVDTLRPIVPYAAERHFSRQSQQIIAETDLLSPLHPEFKEGERATRDAIDHLEKVLRHPRRYTTIFGSEDFTLKWKYYRETTLFRDKYTDEWEYFCTTNGLGDKTDEGIFVSDDIAKLYMTILAQAIGDSQELETITDIPALDAFSVFTHTTTRNTIKNIDAAKGIIELKLPTNIRNIDVNSVIQFRNRTDFREKQKTFHHQLKTFLDSYEGGNISGDFLKSFNHIYKDFTDDVAQTAIGGFSFFMTVWMLATSATTGAAETIKEFAGGMGWAIASTISIRNTWKHTRSKRMTRKYLSDISGLR